MRACLVFSISRMPRSARNRRNVARQPQPTAVRRSRRAVHPPTRFSQAGATPSTAGGDTSSLPLQPASEPPTTIHNTSALPASSQTTQVPVSASTIQAITEAVTRSVLQSIAAHDLAATPPTVEQPTTLPFQLSDTGAHTFSVGTLPGAEAAVQGSVASVLGNLTGESMGAGVLSPVRDRPGDVFTPMSLSIDSRVPGKLKAKIWAHEYFDFGLLLTNSPIEQQYQLSFTTSKDSGSTGLATLCLEPTNKPKPISTIEAWTNAFQIYVGVYTSKFPQEAPALMKYGEVVRDLAVRGANWRYYDTNFRYLKQQQPSNISWGAIHWELWIRSQNLTPRPLRPLGVGGNPSTFVPRGYCRKYHRGGNCTGCSYKHECHKCHRLHPSFKCNFRPSSSSTSSTTVAAQSRPTNPSQAK